MLRIFRFPAHGVGRIILVLHLCGTVDARSIDRYVHDSPFRQPEHGFTVQPRVLQEPFHAGITPVEMTRIKQNGHPLFNFRFAFLQA